MAKKSPQQHVNEMFSKENAVHTSERSNILLSAEKLTSGNRNDLFNDPKINMSAFQELLAWAARWQAFNIGTSANGDGHDAAMVMVYSKITRIVVGASHADNYIDAAAYLAMAWECEARIPVEEPAE